MKKHSLPDWATVHRELRNKCVTLQLLWEEYCERNPGGFYSYNHYCRMYREWLKTTSPSMRQVHKAGEKLFVDYCGPTVGVTDPETGEIRTAQVIVAVLGASSYTWAEATRSQQLEDWVMSHVRCFQWLGGVPELVVPDNLKSATSGHVSMILMLTLPTSRCLSIIMSQFCLRGHVNRKIKPKLKLAFRLLNAGSWPESGMRSSTALHRLISAFGSCWKD